jgi:hypothetical protein
MLFQPNDMAVLAPEERLMKHLMSVVLVASMAVSALAQTKPVKKIRKSTAPTVQSQIDDLKKMITDQQQQIQALTRQLQQREHAGEQAREQASAARSAADEARTAANSSAQKADEAQSALTKVNADLTDVKANATSAAVAMQEQQKAFTNATESPLTLHYKGITITPGGFFAAETVWRQHGMTSDDNTPFNSIPYAGAGGYHLSEFYGSGRQSRPTVLIEGKLPRAKFTAYGELDFLSAGVTSNNNQSNSYTNRMRQLWAQVALTNGWSFTAGHMWSLVTETKSGMDNRTEAIPSLIDHAYNVGFSWSRQFGFRVVKNFNNKVWLGLAVENAQTLMTAHGNANNFVFGNAGTGGGLFNPTANYSYNVSPDYVVKAVWQPKYSHYEVFGVFSPLRDRVYPNAPASTAGSFNDTKIGAGLGANARWLVANKHVEFGLHYLGGDGVGRYGTSTLPDATVRPDGTLQLLPVHQGLATLEFHHPKFDIYANGGTEHVARYWQLNSAGKPVGYGSPLFVNSGCAIETVPAGGNGFQPGAPANCNGDTRNLIEYSAGFYLKFYNGPKGRVQWGPQYSHIIKNSWTGVGGGPQTTENMVITSFRYYLP